LAGGAEGDNEQKEAHETNKLKAEEGGTREGH
jgi:hypothetical protein